MSRVVLLDPPLDAAKTAAPRLGPLSYCRPGTAAPSLRPMRGGLTTRVLQRRLTGWGNGVFVLGMHRSGTSAATRVINLMGLPLGDATDLIEPDAGRGWRGPAVTASLATRWCSTRRLQCAVSATGTGLIPSRLGC